LPRREVGETTRADVQEYYGTTLQKSEDLKTNACLTAGSPPPYVRQCLKKIHPEVLAKYYGCGLCLPAYDLSGCSVLDLGCGAGRDVYIASQLVGKGGRVVGVDMTAEQLETARAHQEYHAQQFGFGNTQFLQGYLESLEDIAELQPESFDVIISNCVLNLCIDKPAVLRSCHRLLKAGGEMYFSDVYSNRRVPAELQRDKVLWGECVSGALYWNDFVNLAKGSGFADPRLVEDAPITLGNKKMQEAVAAFGDLQFYSATYRLLKMDGLEPACEDYGQAVSYKGTIRLGPAISAAEQNGCGASPACIDSWTLDKHHVFETGRIVPVCGNTYRMLCDNPRAAPHFDFYGTWDRHYGIFEGCGSSLPFDAASTAGGKGGGAASTGSCCG
jgi:arsenite methyltransferase